MAKTEIAVSLDSNLADEVDTLVRQQRYSTRSHAIEEAITEQLRRLRRTRLADGCAQMDRAEERALAEESFGRGMAEWPEY